MAFRFSIRTALAITAVVAYLSVLVTPLLYYENYPAFFLLAISSAFMLVWFWSLVNRGDPPSDPPAGL
jgi:hypothetical protein